MDSLHFVLGTNWKRIALNILALGLGAAILHTCIDYMRVLRLRSRMPPGPLPLPLFGNYWSIPSFRPWCYFEELSKFYDSSLITIWNGHRPVVMAHDSWTAHDLLEKRASENSSRPRFIALAGLADSPGSNFVSMPYGEKWRAHRKIFHSHVGSHKLPTYKQNQINEGRVLVEALLQNQNSDAWMLFVERYVASVINLIAWGRRISRDDDYIIQLAKDVFVIVDWVVPGYWLLEAIPQLTQLPSILYPVPAAIDRQSNNSRSYFLALAKEALNNKGEHFAKYLFQEKENLGLSDVEIGQLTFSMIGAGFDTTSATLLSFVLAMCKFPEVQKKAQEEIDRVIGRDRSPGEDDDQKILPYIAALVQEVLRWRSVAALGGIPHGSLNDQEYKGYYIPKDTWIIGNLWAIHRNPRDFPEPDRLEPERFIAGSQFQRPYPNQKGHSGFGWGRRVCSGQHLAEAGVFTTITRILWTFTILPALDEQGKEMDVDIFNYTNCQNTRPNKFKARFIPRDDATVKIVKEEAIAARESLSQFDGETKIRLTDFT